MKSREPNWTRPAMDSAPVVTRWAPARITMMAEN